MNLHDPIDLALLAAFAIIAIAKPVALLIPGAILVANAFTYLVRP